VFKSAQLESEEVP